MATHTFIDVSTSQQVQLSPAIKETLLSSMEMVERKNFPTSEALDFASELKKRNTELLVYFGPEYLVVAYAVFNRVGKTVMLHKIVVREQCRRQGIARKMLKGHIVRLSRTGCVNMQLWVDETREPARKLYQGMGFEEVDHLEDYYSPGRTGIKMELSLSYEE